MIKTSGARRICSTKWNKLAKRVIFYVIMIGLFIAFIDSTETDGTNGLTFARGTREKLAFLLFFADHNGYSLRQFTRNRLPLNIIAAAWRASYFSPTFYLLPCCFLQISGLLAVGNPRNPRFIQFEGSRCKCPEITFLRLRKLDAFKIRVVTNLDRCCRYRRRGKLFRNQLTSFFLFRRNNHASE